MQQCTSNWWVAFFWGFAMSKVPFTKPATTHEEQVELLRSRGMIFPDKEKACFYLKHINYYRLGAYWLPFEIDPVHHTFKDGTNFETVLALYNFDRSLRLLVMDAIERVEISARTSWTYHMGHTYGTHAHLIKNIAYNAVRHEQYIENMKKEVERADEIFVNHAKNKYQEELPAIWVVSEIISLGLLSKLYTNLKPMGIRKKIAQTYMLDEKVLGSWLHHLTYVRNISAHHSRLWNRDFINIPKKPKNKPEGLAEEFQDDSRKLYNTLLILLHFMDIISPKHKWRSRMVQLLRTPNIPLKSMDFPDDWQASKIWQEVS